MSADEHRCRCAEPVPADSPAWDRIKRRPRAGQTIRATIRSTRPRTCTFELTRDADRFPTGWRLFYRQTCAEAHMHRMLCPQRDAHEAVVVVDFGYEVVQ